MKKYVYLMGIFYLINNKVYLMKKYELFEGH